LSDKNTNIKPDKTPGELLQQAQDEYAQVIETGNFAEKMLSFAKLMQAKEAAKPLAQRQREEKERIENAKLSVIKKAEKENKRLDALFQPWLKRDTWLVWQEAMFLNLGIDPTSLEAFLDPRDQKQWELAQSCAGISLNILNINAKPEEWRVKPFEWVRWLKEKDQTVNPKLLDLLYPIAVIKPTAKTAEATLSRSILKVKRQRAIKEFSNEAAVRARKLAHHWDSQSIPVTKSDFLSVFKKEYPEFKQISPDSFDRDIADIGIKFQRGTKSNKNNILKSLFINK